jgi:hypothetical protein
MRGAMLAPFETFFADALLNADQPIPCGITAHNAAVPARRFAVYRNNVVVGLGKALKSRFPVVEKIVGEEYFAAMARVFVKEQPPRSPLLATYGDNFPAFIAAFEPARGLPYLADVARLEAARTRAYHAADAMPVGAEHFATLDSHAVGAIRIDMHPSTGIVRSPYPIVTIWAMNSGEHELSCLGASRTPAAPARGGSRHAGVRETCTTPEVNRPVRFILSEVSLPRFSTFPCYTNLRVNRHIGHQTRTVN